MKLNITKNFIITFFVILAIYQTAELWFEGFSNHNFFYSFFNKSNDYDDDALLYSLDSIVVNKGSDKLICLKNNIYKNDYKTVFDDAIKITVENSSKARIGKIDWNSILSARSVIYQYSSGIDGKSIARMFGFDESLLTAFTNTIDTITITSYTTTFPENITVAFGNRTSGKGYIFSLENNQYIYTVYNTIGSISETSDIYYTSSVKNGLDLFKGNLFIPQWNGEELSYYPIKTEDPFYENGEFQQFRLERAADVFFDNPVSKWSSSINDVFTYSDENTVVKYYNTGVMEYYNYSADKAKSENDFYSQYKSAVSLLKRDSNIENEYYLSGFSSDSEKTIFYFDYKINNFCVKLSDEVKKVLGMNSVIEVTVSGGKVSKYCRFTKKFVNDVSGKSAIKMNFLKAADEVFADIQSGNKENSGVIENIELAYFFETEEKAFLKWFMDIDGKQYVKGNTE